MKLSNKTNLLHLFFLSLLATTYVFPLIIIGQVTVYPHDNLDSGFVLDHIISKIYRGDFDSVSYLLGGTIKWYYLEEIFYPINILHYFLSDKFFYFSDVILKKLFAYFSFYLLAKSLGNSKFNSGLGGVLFSTIITETVPIGMGLPFLPYILYLLVKKNTLETKHYFLLFLIGLNSSLIQDALVFIFLLPLAFIFLNKKKNLSIYFQVILTVIFASILSNIHLIIGAAFFEPVHRIDRIQDNNIILPFFTLFQNFFNGSERLSPKIIFSLPLYCLSGFVIFVSIFLKRKEIKLIIYFLVFVVIGMTLLQPSIINNFLFGIFEILKGYNFQRVKHIIPLTFALLFIFSISELKRNNLKKFIYTLTFVSVISLQLATPLTIIARSFLKANMNLNEYDRAKSSFLNTKFNKFFEIILNKKNYSSNKINLKNSVTETFDNYYKFNDYSYIKNIVKEQRVMSVGLDPMIAAMNDIKVIDGYHNLYPLSYKFKFRKIIEKELEKNISLKNYYDSWGNRVYAFYNNQNNIMLNFQAAKKIGAEYVISKFPIKNSELEKVCGKCNGANEIFLYKIL